jgi:hypothetical protein
MSSRVGVEHIEQEIEVGERGGQLEKWIRKTFGDKPDSESELNRKRIRERGPKKKCIHESIVPLRDKEHDHDRGQRATKHETIQHAIATNARAIEQQFCNAKTRMVEWLDTF